MNLLIKGAAKNINIMTSFDLCLIPVPKFPTPNENTKIYASNIIKTILKVGFLQITFKLIKIKKTKYRYNIPSNIPTK